jgi:hypothetical protein
MENRSTGAVGSGEHPSAERLLIAAQQAQPSATAMPGAGTSIAG